MSNIYNEVLTDKAIDIVDQMIADNYIKLEERDNALESVFQSLLEEGEVSIEAQMDDNSGDEQ
jgi:ATP-dependent Clp protease ATP-binding subunit ClpA